MTSRNFGRNQPTSQDIAAEVVESLLGNLDGTVTRAEAVSLGAAFGLSAIIGAGLTVTLFVTGTDGGDALQVGRYVVLTVGTACTVRLVADILKLGRGVMVLLAAVSDWREKEAQRPAPPGPNIQISVPTSDHSIQFLNFEGEDGLRALAFARAYLANYDSKAVDYPEAEKFYVGAGDEKPWSRGTTSSAGYQGWQEFKRRMIDASLAFETGNRWRITERGRRALRELDAVARKDGL